MDKTENKKTKKRYFKKRYVTYFLFSVVSLILILFLLLQLTPVQNFIVSKVTDNINGKIDGEVSIDHVDLSIAGGLELEGFKLLKTNGDTILNADALTISLTRSLWSILDKDVAINEIDLSGPIVRITKEKGKKKSDLALIIEQLSNPNSEKQEGGDPIKVDIKEVEWNELDLGISDFNNGDFTNILIDKGHVVIDTFLEDNLLDIKSLSVTKPIIRILKEGNSTEINIQDDEVEEIVNTVEEDSSELTIKVDQLFIADGIFSMDNNNKPPHEMEDVIDFAHFEFSDINLLLQNLRITPEQDIFLDIKEFKFRDNKDFNVQSLTSDDVRITSTEIDFPTFNFVTDKTKLTRSLRFSFNDFSDFSDLERKVTIDANFTNSRVHFGDLMHFIKSLNRSSFFLENKNETLAMSGRVSGTIDRLQGRDMNISIGDDFYLNANFSTRNLTQKNRELINIGMKDLRTDMTFLKGFIPGFRPPENFNKLGTVSFKGRFDGYLKDFVAFGSLNTALGDAFMDMRLDIKDGSSAAQYSGELSLEQFDLGQWTDNTDFGFVDFTASIDDGRGLTLNSVYSDLYALVESLEFKGYEYRDFEMDAQVDRNKFNGEFSIADENIDFVFDGNIELKDNVPYMDFKANIENIDLNRLNLSNDPFIVRGNMDINAFGKDVNDVVGELIASDLYIAANDTVYQMDTISLSAEVLNDGNRAIDLYSDIAEINLEGEFDVNKVVPSVKKILKENYPHYTQNWRVDYTNDRMVQDLRFDINLRDSKNFLELIGVNDFRAKNLKAKGSLNTEKSDLSIAATVPSIIFKNNSFWDSQILISSDRARGDILINVDSTVIGSNSFNPIDLQSRMVGDTVNFLVSTTELADSLESIDIQGRLIPHEKGYEMSITDNKIIALGGEWTFERANKIVIGSKYHELENVRLSDGKRSITIDDVHNKGVALFLADWNFSTLNTIINYDKMDFAGQGDLSVFVDDVYSDLNVEANMYVDDFTINQDSYGTFEMDVSKEKDQPVNALISLGDDQKEFVVNALFDPENDNFLDAKVRARDFPIYIFEYLLGDGIKDTYGGVDLDATVKGPISKLDIDGTGYLTGGVTVIYTGVPYRFDDQEVRVTEEVIDLTGALILDPEGGVGRIDGGLNHQTFSNFNLDAVISGTDVVALSTTKEDNPLYYGYGKGDMRAEFTGPFHLVNMKITAMAKEGSELNIPISEGETSTDKNFIEFVSREEMINKEKAIDENFRFEGLDIEVDLTLTPQARVNIIFDESRGDIIKGTGRGNMKMYITRYGDFNIFGDYEIEQGEYLFTVVRGVPVAKPFTVRRGGKIRWTGDPLNATLDIKADYQTRSPLNIFLAELATAGPVQAASRASTPVNLILSIGGTLFAPQVTFDLDFPNLDGELRNVVDSKMRTLQANPTELNSQVMGLIMFNSFLPSSATVGSGATADIGSTGIGTLSEFVSSQLSLLFTGLLNEALADNGLISGIDFDIGLRKNSFYGVESEDSDLLPDEIEVKLKNRFRFLDERLSLDLGGNYVRDNFTALGDYFIGDFALEYFLTDDRRLKLRLYGKFDYDQFYQERRQKYGVGIGYRKEFGTLADFKETMSKRFREQIQGLESQD